MRKFLARIFRHLAQNLEEEKKETTVSQQELEQEADQEVIPEETIVSDTQEPTLVAVHKEPKGKAGKKQENPRRKKPREGDIVTPDPSDIRDMVELMEVPFLALSKNRTEPINYASSDGRIKVKVSRHTGHYLASIYDWDIVLLVASKMQEIINLKKDIPPRTLVIPRHELLKSLYRHNGKKEEKDLKASLARLKLTGIETTIRNEDGRYDAGFGFLDSWGYTDRTDIKEIRITLSQWLYDGICKKGSLLKVHPEYFKITSGIKKFLYRTARKHVGTQNESWILSVEKLYEKSGSEREFKKFKYDLKKAVLDKDISGYSTEWLEEDGKAFVRFINIRKELENSLKDQKK